MFSQQGAVCLTCAVAENYEIWET